MGAAGVANQGPASRSTVETSLPEVPRSEAKRLLGDLLRGVSRSFYLTLRVLPTGLRQPVGLAYLLARAADTIADTRLLAPSQRLDHLLRFREQVQGPADLPELRQIGLGLFQTPCMSLIDLFGLPRLLLRPLSEIHLVMRGRLARYQRVRLRGDVRGLL